MFFPDISKGIWNSLRGNSLSITQFITVNIFTGRLNYTGNISSEYFVLRRESLPEYSIICCIYGNSMKRNSGYSVFRGYNFYVNSNKKAIMYAALDRSKNGRSSLFPILFSSRASRRVFLRLHSIPVPV